MQPYIGIDFGTTYSSMAWVNPDTGRAQIIKNAEGEDKTPSVVYFGEGDPIVGTPAEQMLEDETERWRVIASVKRSLVSAPTYTLPGGTRVKPVEIVAAILRKLKQDAETLNFHAPVTHAVISAPASFGTLEHRRLVEAGQMAGFEEIKIAPEPVMAALAYSREGLNVGKHVLVYDLGGGTFDLALLSYDATERTYRLALEPQGRADVGGDDFDRALYDYLDYLAQEQFGRAISPRPYELDQHFLLTCRKRKENLSTSTQATFSSYLLSAENGSNSPVLFRSNVTRGTLEELIDHRVSLTVELTKALLVSAQEQDIYVDTLVLIGGSSRVPMVQRKLTDALAPLKPLRWANQDVAVALGAAYQAQEMWGKAVKPTVSVVSSQSSLTENEQQYRRTVETAWLRRRLDRLERDHLTQVTYKLALDANTTSRIEHEVMGMNRYEAYEASQMQHKDEQPDRIRADVKQDAPSSSTLPSAAGPSPFARSLQVWAIWVGANTVAWLPLSWTPNDYDYSGYLLFFATWGLVLGLVQWFVLRRYRLANYWWVLVTAVCLFASAVINGGFIESSSSGLVIGIVLGIAQSLLFLLRKSLSFSVIWGLLSIAGWYYSWALFWQDVDLNNYALGFGDGFYLLAAVIAGILYGAVTGLPLTPFAKLEKQFKYSTVFGIISISWGGFVLYEMVRQLVISQSRDSEMSPIDWFMSIYIVSLVYGISILTRKSWSWTFVIASNLLVVLTWVSMAVAINSRFLRGAGGIFYGLIIPIILMGCAVVLERMIKDGQLSTRPAEQLKSKAWGSE